jgi:hypothetical protein
MSNLKKALENQSKQDELAVKNTYWFKPWSWDFYTKSVSFFLLILLISMGGMYNVKKENLITFSKETTTKNTQKAEENNKLTDKSKSNDLDKEVTVVEKVMLLNQPNESNSDKKSD